MLKDNVIPAIDKFLAETISVYTLSGETKINSVQGCENFNLPNEVVANNNRIPNGKNIIVYVLPVKDFKYAATVVTCLTGDLNNRPIVGKIELNLDIIHGKLKRFEEYYGTLLHEVIHLLGFNRILFRSFFNRETGQKYNFSEIYQHNYTSRGTLVDLLKTPKVIGEARLHYQCETMEGMELENQDPGTHWDQRIVGNEIMNSYQSTNQVMSNITAALLEDSGWYKVNHSNIICLAWGKGRGCDFINNPCMDPTPQAVFPEFCNVKDKPGCTFDHSALAKCSGAATTTNEFLDQDVNYYQNNSYHYINNMDNCPAFIPEYPVEYGLCTFDTRKVHLFQKYDQGFGINSRCFTGTWYKIKGNATYHNGCINTKVTFIRFNNFSA